jgi:hypothetical protein
MKSRRLFEKSNKKNDNDQDVKYETDQKKLKCMFDKDKHENSNMGDYQNMYPLPRGVSEDQDRQMDQYDYIYFRKSRDIYMEHSTLGVLSKTKAREEFENLLTLIQSLNDIQYG